MRDGPGKIDHYRVTRKLGEGGMGVVYAAERLDRQVEIKMISDAGGGATARARFGREARAAASVSHPNVCQLYEIGEADAQLYLVMELLEGESLASRLERVSINDSEARLSPILREMKSRQQEAEAAFVEAGGDRLLGLHAGADLPFPARR